MTLTAGDATFENLTITGGSSTNQGGGIHVDGGGHDVILTNVIVDGNEAADDGGGIWIDSGNTLTIVNSTLSNNVALGWGGAIYSNGADVTVIESTISGNSSTSGGGIASNGGTMDLSGGDVANNTANSGALFWDFENATAVGPVTTATGLSTGSVTGFVSQTGGGSNPVEGAENFGAAGKVHLTRFMSETGNYPYMEFISTGPVQLEDVTFQHFHNHNLTYPTNPDYDVQLQLFEGEGWSDIGSPLNLSDANYGETSTIGLTSVQTLAAGTHRIRWVPRGLAYGTDTDTEYFALNDLTLNFAPADGGGILANDTNVSVSGTTLSTNTASNGGAIAAIDGATLTVDAGSVVDANVADASGGGVWVADCGECGPTSAMISDSTISNNGSQEGGGIGVEGSATLTVVDSTIQSNSSVGGAGIKIEDGSALLQGVHLLSNTATGLGGGLYARFAPVTIESSQSRPSLIDLNAAAQGGGILMFSDDLIVTGATVSNNTGGSGGGFNVAACVECSASATITDTIITSNTANIGAGLRIQSWVDLTLDASTVDGNISTGDGAGLNTFGTATITNSVFSNNDAGGDGGGIYSTSDLTIESSDLVGNEAASSGGAVYWLDYGYDALFDEVTVDGNTANTGGGLYLEGGGESYEIVASTISNNVATGTGWAASGGIYSGTTGLIENSTISGNSAPNGGTGGIFSGWTVDLNHVTITNNTDSLAAGGLVTDESQFRMGNSIVANNTSATGDPDCSASIISLGRNVVGIDDYGCATWLTNDLVGDGDTIEGIGPVDPGLLPLGNYGGPTETHALEPSSPARDRAFPPGGYTNFNPGANILTNGSASLDANRLRLTSGGGQAGTGFWRQPILLDGNGFATTFDFQISAPYAGLRRRIQWRWTHLRHCPQSRPRSVLAAARSASVTSLIR